MATSLPSGVKNKWDLSTQELHGGQTWMLCGDKYVADFSVTTNGLGTPKSGMDALLASAVDISHYPSADCEEALAALGKYMAWPSNRLLIGNGASEFIDLIMRLAPAGAYRTGPFIASYKEYERAAKVAGRTVIPHSDKATKAGVTVIIHPNSPSGEFMELPELEAVVQAAQAEGGVVLVDESFMPHMGPNWHDHSALALVEKYPATIIVVNSWTKIWCCPGLRLGSVACAEHWYKIMKKNQTPWSCNNMAQAFCAAVANDVEFQQQTWKLLPEWRLRQQGYITALGWTFNESSPLWVPWLFVDCGSAEVAERAAAVAQEAGCPVRWCASFGCPSRLRLGVRTPAQQDKLQEAWSKMLGK